MPGLASTTFALVAALQVAISGGTRVWGSEQALEAASASASNLTAGTPSDSPCVYDGTASDPSSQYNGRVYDPGTGFHDYGARMYWPEIGRFISADSYAGNIANPASLNRYSYVHNNPYKYTDPTGHFAWLLPFIPAITWCGMGGCERMVRTVQALGPIIAEIFDAQQSYQDGTLALPPGQTTASPTAQPSAPAQPGAAAPTKPAKPRFIGQPDGQLVDTDATPAGSYDQPDGGRTDVLQGEDHGAGQSHTHDPKVNVAPNGKRFINGRQQPGRPVSAQDVKNIEDGTAPPSPPKGR